MQAAAFSDAVLAWWREHGRDLPWRRTRDPYALLVAEVMLQQTQVARVVDRWTAWLERWPDAPSLAAATPAEVLQAWQGMGYNRRALNLHRASRVVAAHGWPTTYDGLRTLPGVGPYTAAALAVQAFGADLLPVDVNVRRVLERALGGTDLEPPTGRASDFLQALFDLGATVCLARVPRCDRCPVAGSCPSRGRRYEPARRQGRFEGSRRQARGRLLDRLREGPVALPDADAEIVAALVRDGLAVVTNRVVTLPTG